VCSPDPSNVTYRVRQCCGEWLFATDFGKMCQESRKSDRTDQCSQKVRLEMGGKGRRNGCEWHFIAILDVDVCSDDVFGTQVGVSWASSIAPMDTRSSR